MKEDDLFLWKFGQMSRSRAYSAAAKGKGGISMSAGEIAIRAENTIGWYDYTSGVSVAGAHVTKWANKLLDTASDLNATGTPHLTADGILFDGVGDYLNSGALALNQPTTIYIVFRQLTATNLDYIFDGNLNTGGALVQNGTGSLFANAGAWSGENANLALNVWGIVRVIFNGATSKTQVNATAAVTGNFGGNVMNGITIGSSGALASGFSNIEVKEAIFRNVDDSLSTDEVTIYAYLKSKYGL